MLLNDSSKRIFDLILLSSVQETAFPPVCTLEIKKEILYPIGGGYRKTYKERNNKHGKNSEKECSV